MVIDPGQFIQAIKEAEDAVRIRCAEIARAHRDAAIGQGRDGYAVAEAIEREIYNNKGAALFLR